MEDRIIKTRFGEMHGYRYIGKGWFLYEGAVLVGNEIKSVKKTTIEDLKVAISPVKYNGSFIDTIPQ